MKDHTKNFKKIDFCHFSRGVLSLGWGGVWAYCSVNAWIVHSRWVKYDSLWSRMTDYGPGWHTRGHGGSRGSRGAPAGTRGCPGGSRIPPAPKRVIKQQNNDPKPWFKVPKVCPDPKGMVFTHLWGIWDHLGALKQWYLLKSQYCQKPHFR